MNFPLRNMLMLVLMVVAAGFAIAMRPQHMIADREPGFELGTVIPQEFGDWREEAHSPNLIIDPQQQETLETIYSQILSRTYVNKRNVRVMLSIAYGRDQRDANQAHKPEICYPAQGFVLLSKQRGVLETPHGAIPVTRVQTHMGERYEPVTYWTTVGRHVVLSGADKKLQEIRYGLKGDIPDGLLFRVSSIDKSPTPAFSIQDSFVRDLLDSLEPTLRERIAGEGS